MPKTFYIGIKALIVHNNKILMLKGKDNSRDCDYWDLPGGRMENDETIADALQRELREELPLIKNIQIHRLINAYTLPHTLQDGQGLMLLIYNVTAHLPVVTLSNEHYDYKWVDKSDIEFLEQEGQINLAYKEMLHQGLQSHNVKEKNPEFDQGL